MYDTETTNIGEGVDTRAYPVLYIYNDLTQSDLTQYKPDCESEQVFFFRKAKDLFSKIEKTIADAKGEYVPIICAYNLMFDLQPIIYTLNQMYDIALCAQSSTNIYTLDLVADGKIELRFWDTYFLEPRGLAAMGRVCGFAKANGDWDYTLIRTPSTPLTSSELRYAKRDVQVIPAYLTYLLKANDFLKPDMLGSSVLTKTSLTRQFAKRKIGNKKVEKENGKK